ncbi:class I SAM-dependent rRNA methyltransferase [Sulfurivirga sp.]|uniref:class I SAM-dependent rRNA methyltransferase n=1 Tax=Sulfurivirga sp. TaxID=2614236 RepID=UPI0025D70D9B|nr:class I SAM-dependent rRNA methyltransferase [Sulfurivirga sp.]
MSAFQTLRLKKGEERRIRQGHLWIYSNEIDTRATPLRQFEPGEAVIIEAANGKALGVGYVNPHSLIAARLLTRNPDTELGVRFFKQRLQQAEKLRALHFSAPFYRLAFGESDFLPGLVVDRHGDVLVVQITTAGMERLKDRVITALEALYEPAAIVLRNDLDSRKLEGLPLEDEVIGALPEEVIIEENATRFILPVLGGQKTGWFYDHRESRRQLQQLVAGKRVLDVFSYLGGWGLEALNAGASEAVFVERSELALDHLERSAQLNGLAGRITQYQGNVFEVLPQLINDGERFDVVIVDPPAFIKRKKDFKAGKQGYQRINELALRLLNPDGILVSASCSHHMPREVLREQIQRAARQIDRMAQVFFQGGQGPDHPVHPAMPETEYLKTFFLRAWPGQ